MRLRRCGFTIDFQPESSMREQQQVLGFEHAPSVEVTLLTIIESTPFLSPACSVRGSRRTDNTGSVPFWLVDKFWRAQRV